MSRGDAPGDGEVPAPLARSGLPPELLAEIRNAMVDARQAADLRAAREGPLRELADALRANAEAMARMQETQERIARSVDRADRSEAMLQSTQALNETFRGVRRAQDALVGRLETEKKQPLRAALLGIVGTLVVGGGVAVFFLNRGDEFQGRVDGLRAEVMAALATGRQGGGDVGAERELLGRLAELESTAARSDADRESAERDLEEIRGSLATLRREKEALEAKEREASLRAARQGVLEEEVARLRRELAAARESDGERERRLLKAETELETLRRTASAEGPSPAPAATGSGTAAAAKSSAAPAPTASGEGAIPAPADPPLDPARPDPPAVPRTDPALSPSAVTDPAEVARLLEGLNALLGRVEGRETWKFVSARAVDRNRLVDAVLETRDNQGTETRRFEAGEARLTLRTAARSLEVRMKGGSVRYMGRVSVPFLDDLYAAHLTVDPGPVKDAAHPLIETTP